jgi:N-methylhydantoinase B
LSREAGDLANGLFDEKARMVAQAVTGTPGHINSLAAAARNLLDNINTQELKPGDVLITNDPWMSAGPLLRYHSSFTDLPG